MNIKKNIMISFLKIGKNKSFDKVTINEIIEDCGISRSTFYYYFQDIPDVIDYYLENKIIKTSDVAVEAKSMQEGVRYCAENLIFDFPECKSLLNSKWRMVTEQYLHKHWYTYSERMISAHRRGISIREESRKFLIRFVSGAFCDLMINGVGDGITVDDFVEQFCLLINTRHEYS